MLQYLNDEQTLSTILDKNQKIFNYTHTGAGKLLLEIQVVPVRTTTN